MSTADVSIDVWFTTTRNSEAVASNTGVEVATDSIEVGPRDTVIFNIDVEVGAVEVGLGDAAVSGTENGVDVGLGDSITVVELSPRV